MVVSAEQGVRRRNGHRLDAGVLAERQQQALITQHVFKHGSLKFPSFHLGAQLPNVNAGQRQEARQPLRIICQKAQGPECNGFCVIQGDSIGL